MFNKLKKNLLFNLKVKYYNLNFLIPTNLKKKKQNFFLKLDSADTTTFNNATPYGTTETSYSSVTLINHSDEI